MLKLIQFIEVNTMDKFKYNVGDMAIIEGEGVKKHEDGQIFFWNGGNWYQHILIKMAKLKNVI